LPRKKTTQRADVENWCRRCQERDAVPDPRLPLTNPKHEQFARNLSIHKMGVTDSYIKAGYKLAQRKHASTAASQLKRRLDVQNRVAHLLEKTVEIDVQTREWVDAQLREIVDRCMQAKPHYDRNGKADGQWHFDAANANKALYAMGKDRGMFVEKFEMTGVEKDLQGKSIAEIKEMIQSAAIELGRDFVIQLGEQVGLVLHESGGKDDSGAQKASDRSVPTLQ